MDLAMIPSFPAFIFIALGLLGIVVALIYLGVLIFWNNCLIKSKKDE